MIVVAGEALVDLVAQPDGALRPHPGGGPFNVARTIGRLEQPVAFVGRISRDAFGEQHVAMLAADGVAVDLVERTDDPSTLAIAEVDAGGAATYRFYVDGTAAPGLAGRRCPRERRRCTWARSASRWSRSRRRSSASSERTGRWSWSTPTAARARRRTRPPTGPGCSA